ncbi:MAG TPA: TRAP transporter substrate-binding protein DctP [bacterium]
MHNAKIKINNFICLTVFVTIIFVFMTKPASPAEKPDFVLKFGTPAPVGTSWAEIEDEASKKIFERSKGRLKLIWYQGNVMGDEPDTIRKVRVGQLHGGYYTIMGFAVGVPEMAVLSLPLLFRNYDEVDYVLPRIKSTTVKLFKERGFVFTGWLEVGFVQLFSKSSNIRTLEDLKDQKLKLWRPPAPPMFADFFNLVGISGSIPMPLYDVLMGIQTGMLNTVLPTYYVCIALQWCSHVKYMNTTPLAYTPGGGLIDQRAFDSMPKDLQSILLEELEAHNQKTLKAIREDNERSLKAITDKGDIQIINLTEKEKREMEKISWDIYPKLADKHFPKSFFDEITKYLKEYRGQK